VPKSLVLIVWSPSDWRQSIALEAPFCPSMACQARFLAGGRGQGPQRRLWGRPPAKKQCNGHRETTERRTVSFTSISDLYSSRHLWLSNRMISSVINRHEQRVPAGSTVLSEVETSLASSWCQKAAGSQCNRRSPVRSNRQAMRNARSPAASSRQGTRLPLDQQRILVMVLVLKRLWACPWPLHWTI
jgi:hypothetical protein